MTTGSPLPERSDHEHHDSHDYRIRARFIDGTDYEFDELTTRSGFFETCDMMLFEGVTMRTEYGVAWRPPHQILELQLIFVQVDPHEAPR